VKVALIGAVSTGFAKTLIGDLLSFAELEGTTIALIDRRRRLGGHAAARQAAAAAAGRNVGVRRLTVEAALTGCRDQVDHAALLDPHTAAELTLEEIHELVDALLLAHGDLVQPLA
jgi:alpha-galactosidase/6-phospho-beta-glucosidase family protein